MASINGISIKSLKNFRDHEGMTIHQGNVYYKGRKLGFWSQDSWGGCDTFHFDEHILDEEVERYRKSDMVDEQYRSIVDLSCLLGDLVFVIEDEKLYKKAMKEGHTTLVMANDGFHVVAYATKESKAQAIESDYYKEFVEDCKDQFFIDWDGETTIYESLADFEIRV